MGSKKRKGKDPPTQKGKQQHKKANNIVSNNEITDSKITDIKITDPGNDSATLQQHDWKQAAAKINDNLYSTKVELNMDATTLTSSANISFEAPEEPIDDSFSFSPLSPPSKEDIISESSPAQSVSAGEQEGPKLREGRDEALDQIRANSAPACLIERHENLAEGYSEYPAQYTPEYYEYYYQQQNPRLPPPMFRSYFPNYNRNDASSTTYSHDPYGTHTIVDPNPIIYPPHPHPH
eukprot:gene20362-1070_t